MRTAPVQLSAAVGGCWRTQGRGDRRALRKSAVGVKEVSRKYGDREETAKIDVQV